MMCFERLNYFVYCINVVSVLSCDNQQQVVNKKTHKYKNGSVQ